MPRHSSSVHLLRRWFIRRSRSHHLQSAPGGCTLDGVGQLFQNCSEDVSVPSFCRLKSRHTRPCSDRLSRQKVIRPINPQKMLNGKCYGYGALEIVCAITITINIKKLQFIQVLTASCIDLHIENSKNDKKVILTTITSPKRQCDAE